MISSNILVWNVRGLNNPARRGVVRRVVLLHNPAIICLQESKLSVVDRPTISQIYGPRCTEFLFQPAIGTRGGIIIAWDPEVVDVALIDCQKSFVAVDCCWRLTDSRFRLVTVYGPQSDADKLIFLDDLRLLYSSNLPCIFTGDFNLIAEATDKNNNNLNRRTMAAFRRFINELELREMYLHGRKYTWTNEQQNATKVKLDRVLFNDPWMLAYPCCILAALATDLSDHCPCYFQLMQPFSHRDTSDLIITGLLLGASPRWSSIAGRSPQRVLTLTSGCTANLLEQPGP